MSKSAKAMFATKDISDYMIVCIFEFARQKGLSPREAYLYLSNWGGLEFLETCYPCLLYTSTAEERSLRSMTR